MDNGEPGKVPIEIQRGRGPGPGDLARGEKVVVQDVWLTESSRVFEDTLFEMSAVFSASGRITRRKGHWDMWKLRLKF